MYLDQCVLIAALFLLICSVETISSPTTSSQISDPKVNDTTLSFKYDSIYVYSTPKPRHQLSDNSIRKSKGRAIIRNPQEVYQNIQYAPLILKSDSTQKWSSIEEFHGTELTTEKSTSSYEYENYSKKTSQQPEQTINKHPQFPGTEPPDTRPRKYFPGYNIDLHKAINPNYLVKNRQVNVKYIQTQSESQNQAIPERIPYYVAVQPKEIYSNRPYRQKINPFLYKHGNDLSGRDKKRPLYFKTPKVELNLARVPYIARTVHKASVKVNSNFKKHPSIPYNFFSNLQNWQPAKSHLKPEQKNKNYDVRHNSQLLVN